MYGACKKDGDLTSREPKLDCRVYKKKDCKRVLFPRSSMLIGRFRVACLGEVATTRVRAVIRPCCADTVSALRLLVIARPRIIFFFVFSLLFFLPCMALPLFRLLFGGGRDLAVAPT